MRRAGLSSALNVFSELYASANGRPHEPILDGFHMSLEGLGKIADKFQHSFFLLLPGYGPSSGCCPVSFPIPDRGLRLKVIVLGELHLLSLLCRSNRPLLMLTLCISFYGAF